MENNFFKAPRITFALLLKRLFIAFNNEQVMVRNGNDNKAVEPLSDLENHKLMKTIFQWLSQI